MASSKSSTFFPNLYETCSNFLPHELIILTKFHKDWAKIVDFFIKAHFSMCPIFFWIRLYLINYYKIRESPGSKWVRPIPKCGFFWDFNGGQWFHVRYFEKWNFFVCNFMWNHRILVNHCNWSPVRHKKQRLKTKN